MKELIKSVVRHFGYEIRKIPPPLPANLRKFLNAPECDLEFNHEPDTTHSDLVQALTRRPPLPLKSLDQPTKKLVVEGWRFLPHSYAIVNEWQLLALSRRSDVNTKVREMPFHGRQWETQDGLLEPQAEQTLKSFPLSGLDELADVTLRIAFPYDFAPSRSRLTAVFGTSEHQMIVGDQLRDSRAYRALQGSSPPTDIKVITPSRWSAEGFYKTGLKTEQVLIIPHGVDIDTYHPMPHLRSHIRNKLNVADGDFVFLSVGAMTGNKGIDLLLQAFAEVCLKFPNSRLILKGMDPLYKSKNLLLKSLQLVPARNRQRVIDRITYYGRSVPHSTMAMLYQGADCYVSPYRAEGFNLPVLEATASGIPIICTRGGPTDDFVTDAFARRVESQKVSAKFKDQDVWQLRPSVEHLIAEMCSTIRDNSWRMQAAKSGPLHVRANYTWDHVVDQLIRGLFN